MSSHHVRRAARALAVAGKRRAQADPLVRGADWRTATVAAVGTDGMITTADGIPCRQADTYLLPVVGERCIITRSGAGSWLAIGRPVGTTSGLGTYKTYVPTVSGGGSATWSTSTGWYLQPAPGLCFFTAYCVASAAGSGSSPVMITGPLPLDRSARQIIPGHLGDSPLTNFLAVSFTGGSGATWDRLRKASGANMVGSDITSGAFLTVQGWYRTT